MRCPGAASPAAVEALDSLIDANGRSLLVRARLRQPGRRAAVGHVRAHAHRVRDARERAASCPRRRWCRRAASSTSSRWSTGPTGKVSQRVEAQHRPAPARQGGDPRRAGAPATLVVTAGQARLMRGDARAAEGGRHRAPGRVPPRRPARRRQCRASAPTPRRRRPERTSRAMRISEISIRRPVFATVLSLLMVLVGAGVLQPAGGARVPAHRRAGGHRQHAADRRLVRGDRVAGHQAAGGFDRRHRRRGHHHLDLALRAEPDHGALQAREEPGRRRRRRARPRLARARPAARCGRRAGDRQGRGRRHRRRSGWPSPATR